MRVGFDIDGVLADFCGSYLEQHLNVAFGTAYAPEHVIDFDIASSLGLDPVREWDVFCAARKNGMFRRLKPYPGALDLIQQGDSLLTHRSDEAISDTHYWMKEFRIDVPVYFIKGPKSVVAKQAGIEIMVEDCYENAIELSEHIPQIILVEQPWNARHNHLPRNVQRIKHQELANALGR